MTTLIIYMKSGNSFKVNVETWKLSTGFEIKTLEWINNTKGNALVHVDMNEVEAIVEVN